MMDATDMSTPVTRGELREELTQLRQEFTQEFTQVRQELQQAVAPLATKVELEMWGGALLARIESGERRLMQQMDARFELSEQRVYTEIARHTKAFQEWVATMIAVIDEKYTELPDRVKRLEAKVFAPRRR